MNLYYLLDRHHGRFLLLACVLLVAAAALALVAVPLIGTAIAGSRVVERLSAATTNVPTGPVKTCMRRVDITEETR